MPVPTAPVLPADVAQPTGFLHTLLAMSLTAVAVLRPLYAEDGETIRDFACVSLNPAGQRMLSLPAAPPASLLTLFPAAQHDDGNFALFRRAFATGALERNQTYYQADGVDGYFIILAQRYEDVLVVNFTDTNDQPRSAVEVALRDSQAAEQTARAEAERQRQRFHEVLMQLPAYVAVYHGPDHVYQFVNPPYQSMFPHRSFAGRPFAEVMPEAQGLGVVAMFDRVYQTGEPYYSHELEGWFDFKGTGEPEQVFLNLYLLPLRNAQGQVDGVLDYSYNVTEQVRARQQVEQLNQELESRVQERTRELRQQQVLLGQILSQVPAAVATLSGPEHRFSFFNEPYQRISAGRSVLGRTVGEVFPELVEQGIISLLDQVYATGQPYVGTDILLMLHDAATDQVVPRYIDFTYQPLLDGRQRTHGILIFALDVTTRVRNRKQADTLQAAMLAVVQRQARDREELYQVFEQAPVVVALLHGAEHFFHYCNPAFQALFPGRVLTGRLYANAMPEIVAAGLMPELDRVYATGQPYHGTALPVVVAPPDGSAPHLRYYDFSYYPHREGGAIAGVSIFAYDVTGQVLTRQQADQAGQQVLVLNEELAAINEELTATNSELHTSNTRLMRTNADLDTFVYAASHDLKSPIANIEGLLNALREYLPASLQEPMVPRLLAMMQGAIGRFQQTVGHLTDVSRLQDAQHSQPVETLDLAQTLEDVRLDLLPLLESTRTVLSVAVEACSGVRFSAQNLRSVLFNLLSNAVKYRHPDRTPVVQVRAQCADTQLVLVVQDNGLGLTTQQQGQLFTMFRRLHAHVEGSGVGLYLIKRTIENAGGTITVQSQPHVGSTFTVTLPRA